MTWISKYRLLVVVIVMTMLGGALFPGQPVMARDNCDEVREKAKTGGWEVITVKHIDHVEYVKTIALLVATYGSGAAVKYAEYVAELVKVVRKVQLAEALVDMLGSDNEGSTFTYGNKDYKAMFLTCQHWHNEQVPYCDGLLDCGMRWVRVPEPSTHLFVVAYRNRGVSDVDSEYDKIHLENECDRPIYAAIHHKNLADEWVTRGWYNLDPGEDAYVVNTRNTIIYIYAKSTDPEASRLYWSGDDYHDDVGSDGEVYGFIKRKITTESWGEWTESFTCN